MHVDYVDHVVLCGNLFKSSSHRCNIILISCNVALVCRISQLFVGLCFIASGFGNLANLALSSELFHRASLTLADLAT